MKPLHRYNRLAMIYSVRMRASKGDMHISGAEGLFAGSEIERAAAEYVNRAITHPRGTPDEINITVEKIKKRIEKIKALPVKTLDCKDPGRAFDAVVRLLSDAGISDKSINGALKIIVSLKTMRGAAIMDAINGLRLEPDMKRGIRLSRMGIDDAALLKLSRKLARLKIDTDTVREALILASKAAHHKDIIAELCVSDDPDYTTGYVASKSNGYVRVPNIKMRGSHNGGRVFFVGSGADIESLIEYLELQPVMITDV